MNTPVLRWWWWCVGIWGEYLGVCVRFVMQCSGFQNHLSSCVLCQMVWTHMLAWCPLCHSLSISLPFSPSYKMCQMFDGRLPLHDCETHYPNNIVVNLLAEFINIVSAYKFSRFTPLNAHFCAVGIIRPSSSSTAVVFEWLRVALGATLCVCALNARQTALKRRPPCGAHDNYAAMHAFAHQSFTTCVCVCVYITAVGAAGEHVEN